MKYSFARANSGFANSGQEVLAEVTVSYIHLIPTYACEAGLRARVRASTRENPPTRYPIISSNMGLENGERSMELMRRGKMHLVMEGGGEGGGCIIKAERLSCSFCLGPKR